MPFEVRMPQLGMNQDSATIVAWLKNVGDKVTEGEAIFEVETDKATMEVEARSEGYLSDIQVEPSHRHHRVIQIMLEGNQEAGGVVGDHCFLMIGAPPFAEDLG